MTPRSLSVSNLRNLTRSLINPRLSASISSGPHGRRPFHPLLGNRLVFLLAISYCRIVGMPPHVAAAPGVSPLIAPPSVCDIEVKPQYQDRCRCLVRAASELVAVLAQRADDSRGAITSRFRRRDFRPSLRTRTEVNSLPRGTYPRIGLWSPLTLDQVFFGRGSLAPSFPPKPGP